MKNLEENVDEKIAIENELACYHCGQPCADTDTVWQDDKPFCCTGCETVYSILSENNLCDYYTMDTTPGVPMGDPTESSYYFLDEPSVRKKIIEFDSTSFARILFNIPAIHCISCIWLLENLHKINTGVLRTEVNFS